MDSKCLLIFSTHFFCVFLLIRIFILIAPLFVNSIIIPFSTLFIGYYTLSFTKKKWLSDRIEPHGKAVFITGCDSGFGKATAKRLDSMGFHVFAGCLFPTGPGALELKDKCSETLEIVELDVTKDDSVKAALEIVQDHLGQSELWALINNAGVLKGSSFAISDIQDFQDCIEVNVHGAIRMAKAFTPLLRNSRGRIINLNSPLGRTFLPYCMPYTISKHAEMGFNDCLRLELEAWKISVISVEPDFHQTGLFSDENIRKTICSRTAHLVESFHADGVEHLKKVENITRLFFKLASPNFDIVVDEVESAVLAEYPEIVYRARRNIVFRFSIYLLEALPHEILDLLMRSIMHEDILTSALIFLKPWL